MCWPCNCWAMACRWSRRSDAGAQYGRSIRRPSTRSSAERGVMRSSLMPSPRSLPSRTSSPPSITKRCAGSGEYTPPLNTNRSTAWRKGSGRSPSVTGLDGAALAGRGGSAGAGIGAATSFGAGAGAGVPAGGGADAGAVTGAGGATAGALAAGAEDGVAAGAARAAGAGVRDNHPPSSADTSARPITAIASKTVRRARRAGSAAVGRPRVTCCSAGVCPRWRSASARRKASRMKLMVLAPLRAGAVRRCRRRG